MRLVLHREIPDDHGLRERWNALVHEMECPQVFYTYEWALAVSRAYRSSMKPLLLLAYEGDTLAAIAALATDNSQKEVFFLAGTTADYCDFVCPSRYSPEVAQLVLAELRSLNIPKLRLANLPADSATRLALRTAARKHGFSVFSRPAYQCAQVIVGSRRQPEIKAPVQRQQMVRRHLAAMERIAPVSLHHLKSGAGIIDALPGFFNAHVARFLATGRASNLIRPERRAFLAELAGLLAEQGWVTHTRLLVGDKPVAWNHGFQFAGSWFWYQPTFDSRLQKHSPGFCLLTKIVAEAGAKPDIEVVDLGLGAEGYKERFANASRQTLHVTVTSSWKMHVHEAVRYRTAAAIKRMPRLEVWIRTGLRRLHSLGARLHPRAAERLSDWLRNWCREMLFASNEVCFFEWPSQESMGAPGSHSFTVQPVDLEMLALAAMRYYDDDETLAYLFRAAERLRTTKNQGFVARSAEGVPVHFCWVSEFHGFYLSELRHILKAPSTNSVLIFDCWTPASVRGRGHYGFAVSSVAAELRRAGRAPWIFSAATNIASLRGIAKAGFVPRFSLIQKRVFFVDRLVESRTLVKPQFRAGVSSAA